MKFNSGKASQENSIMKGKFNHRFGEQREMIVKIETYMILREIDIRWKMLFS